MALGKDPKEAKPTQRLVAEVALRVPRGTRMVTALIDTGAQENFLSQHLVVEEGLQAEQTSIGAHTVDGHHITVYGRHEIETRAFRTRKTQTIWPVCQIDKV